ncbi:MAG: hypothetical protein JZD41_03575 [Thermoproteus sp.]|nr:hypothetical protein [Thermoproteus sp.]
MEERVGNGRRSVKVWISTTKGHKYVKVKINGKQQHLASLEQTRKLVDELNARGINGAGIPITPEDIKLIAKAKETTAAETATKEAEEAMKEIEEKKKEAEKMMKRAQEMMQKAEEAMERAHEMMQKAEKMMKQAQAHQKACNHIAEDIEQIQKGLNVLKHSLRFVELENRVDVIHAIAGAARLGDDSAISHMFNFIAFLDGILEYCKEDFCKGFKKYLADIFKYRGVEYDAFEELYEEIMDDLKNVLRRVEKHHTNSDMHA